MQKIGTSWLWVRFHLRGKVAGRTRDGGRWRLSPAVVRFHYGGFSAGITTWIINVSAIPFSNTESHDLQNNANKLFIVLSKVTICLHQHCDSTSRDKLLKCYILTFREIPKPGDWYLKFSNRSEISQTEQQHYSWFSYQITERSGYF